MLNGHGSENGYVLVVVAATLVLLLGFAALAVDLGVMYGAHTSAQRAVDAAALAGAGTFLPPTAFAPQPATALNRAMAVATFNNILGIPIQSSEIAIDVDVPNRLVTVTCTHTLPTFFAHILGSRLATVRVIGHAEASTVATGSSCVKPWFIPNTVLQPGVDYQTVCKNHNTIVEIGPDGTYHLTDFAKTYIMGQASPAATPFTIKPVNPGDAFLPGNFFAIEVGCGPGGDDYRDVIAHCGCGTTIICGQNYSVKTGNMVGPTKQGVDDWMTVFGTVSPDTWGGLSGTPPEVIPILVHPDGSRSDMSHQVVIAPIFDICAYTPAQLKSGTTLNIQVIAFAIIFLKDIQGNDVRVYLIDATGCDPAAPPSGGPEGPMTIPLRLVRTS